MKLDLEPDIKGLLPEKNFDRRDFIWTALGASAALAVSAPVSAQQITTDTDGLDAADVSIPTATGELRGYRAMPAKGGLFPVVLVAAEIFGLNHYMKDICRRLAKAGYYAIVPDLYTRKADLTKLKSMDGHCLKEIATSVREDWGFTDRKRRKTEMRKPLNARFFHQTEVHQIVQMRHGVHVAPAQRNLDDELLHAITSVEYSRANSENLRIIPKTLGSGRITMRASFTRPNGVSNEP